MVGILKEILIAEDAGTSMVSFPFADLEAGKGIIGDRYYRGKGTFSQILAGKPDVEVTLIENEEILAFDQVSHLGYKAQHFRRNLVTEGIRLNELEGKEFIIGEVQLKGIRLCEPCGHLSKQLDAQIMKHMVHKAGLRAQILRGGRLVVGSPIMI